MRTFEITLIVETSETMTVEDVCKAVEENSTLLELDLLEGNVTDILVQEIEIELQ